MTVDPRLSGVLGENGTRLRFSHCCGVTAESGDTAPRGIPSPPSTAIPPPARPARASARRCVSSFGAPATAGASVVPLKVVRRRYLPRESASADAGRAAPADAVPDGPVLRSGRALARAPGIRIGEGRAVELRHPLGAVDGRGAPGSPPRALAARGPLRGADADRIGSKGSKL